MKYAVVLGRILFSLIFLIGGLGNFSAGSIAYAESSGVPLAHIAVPLSGVIAILGALSIILGFRARWGAVLIMIFLVPVTLMMHAYWKVTDPSAAGIQQIMFLKNISMLGTAILISYFGTGPLSLDNLKRTPTVEH